MVSSQRLRRALDETIQSIRSIGVENEYWDDAFLESRKTRYLTDLQLIERYYESGPILEVGALPCHLTLALKKLDYQNSGVDLDPSRAARLIREFDLDIRRCDIEVEPLPFGDERFGLVLLTEVFEHLRIDPLFVLSELNRVLKVGGMLMLSTPNLYSLEKRLKYLAGKGFNDPLKNFKMLRKVGHMGHVREYSPKEMKAFVRYSDFDLIAMEYRNYPSGAARRLPGDSYAVRAIGEVVKKCQALVPRWRSRQFLFCRKTGRTNPLGPLPRPERANASLP